MTRNIILMLSVLLFMSFNTPKSPYHIKGNTINVKEGTKIYLNVLDPNTNDFIKIDSALVRNNSFELKGKNVLTGYASIDLPEFSELLILEPGTIQIEYNAEKPLETFTKGTANNNALYNFTKEVRNRQMKADAFRVDNKELIDKAFEENDGKTLDSLSNEFSKLLDSISQYIVTQTKEHPDSYTSLVVLYQRLYNNIDRNEALINYTLLSKELQSTNLGIACKKMLDNFNEIKVKKGEIAPNFILKDLDGNEINLKTSLGKLTLIHFWEPWCPVCKERLPIVKDLYKKYHDKGLNIISITSDNSIPEIKEIVKEQNMTWPQISDFQTTSVIYGIRVVPTVILLDSEGKILTIDHLDGDIEDIISSHIK
ncbi:redoxin domain-containing protein [Myroides injenensis]|uniref:redoxin domain-containing protein n=1 Tax=Myroides injenensis TaxID=1183151 RepID=UPI00028A0E70|nr:redoxin domain-containing protein [Myroides injenensis]